MNPSEVSDDLEAVAREAGNAYDLSTRRFEWEGYRRAILAAVLPEHERQVRERVAAVYLAEVVWFEENPVDGRRRLAACLSLDEALAAIKADKIHGEPNLIATPVDPSALHGKGGRTWAVHPQGEEPSDEGVLWITEERITRGEA